MKFKVKDMDIETGGPLISILNKKDAFLMDLHNEDRICIKRITKKKKASCLNNSITAALDVAESGKAVKPGYIGLMEEGLGLLGVKQGDIVDVKFSPKPVSTSYIRYKLEGQELNEKQITVIIKDIVDNKLTEIEITGFITAGFIRGLSDKEIIYLTKAMIKSGGRINLNKHPVVDLHCIGGVAGNRTTLVVVPVLACLGFYVPKTSSRAITSPSGTSDTLELLCNVSFSINQIKKIVNKTRACMVWGGAVNLAPADDRFVNVEYPLGIDAQGQMIASIMAKKGSINPDHVLLDIPVGNEAKVKKKTIALKLKKEFKKVGKKLGIKMHIILTDGSQPIGNGIGVAPEIRDILWVFENDPRAPKDLIEKSIMLCVKMIKNVKGVSTAKARKRVKEVLENGKAKEKFFEIIKSQGGKKVKSSQIKLGKYTFHCLASKTGKIVYINNRFIAKIAKLAGSPQDKEAGVYLYKHVGEEVKKGEKILTIYADSKAKRNYAKKVYKNIDGIKIK